MRARATAIGMLVLATAADSSAQVVVRFEGVTAAHHVAILADGWINAACRNDQFHNVTQPPYSPAINLGAINPVHPGCPMEMVAIARHRRPMIVTTALLPDVTSGPLAGLRPLGGVAVRLQRPQDLPVAIWVGEWDGDLASVRADLFTSLGTVLGLGRLGLKASLDVIDRRTDAGAVSRMAGGCPNYTAIRAGGDYRPDRINVYVTTFAGPGGIGYFCPAAGDMVFVDPYAAPGTASHEIGHALSLTHTDGLAGFDEFNLMYQYVWDVRNLSFGQVYRAQINASSWLNRAQVLETRPLVKACQPAASAGVCPALALGMLAWP